MPKCVVFSERAFISILVETQEKIQTETGGVFLGYRKGDIWYVIESIDPGPNSVFQTAYFEYDQAYINHLINKVSRLYSTQLDLIGLWHRHPGSFDSFSGTDDGTNTKYAELDERGAVSALVNIDPYFRLTMFSVTLPLKYEKIRYIVGDSYIPKDLLKKKDRTMLQQQMAASTQQSVVSNANKFKMLAAQMARKQSKSPKPSSMPVELTEFSFHEAIYCFLQQRTLANAKNPEIRLPPQAEDDTVVMILEKLDHDLKFLSQLGIECEMMINPAGALILKESTSPTESHSRFELAFGSQDQDILFCFNECCYKYYPGLFRDAYIEFLSKECEKH